IASEEEELLTVSENGVGKRTEVEAYRLTNRAGSGVISMKLSPKTGKTVVGNVLVDPSQDLMALTSIGKMIRVDMGIRIHEKNVENRISNNSTFDK
ncbi:MAG TPA: DNA gyrase subunit A, partial [Thiomicrorhabdus sp.]|nr:DNA gyrase subunit A [Thiomicrorhabdus sp.]